MSGLKENKRNGKREKMNEKEKEKEKLLFVVWHGKNLEGCVWIKGK